MKMNATEITARREQIKTTRANIKTVVNIYCETSDRTPAETEAGSIIRAWAGEFTVAGEVRA